MLAARIERHMAGAVAERCTRHVHGSVAHTDDCNAIAQLVPSRVGKIVQAEKHVAEALTLDTETAGFFGAGSDKNTLVAVAEEFVNHQHRANGGVGTDGDAHFLHPVLIVADETFVKAEFRDPVLQEPADLPFPLEHRDGITLLRHGNGNCHTGRAAADNRHFFILLRGPGDFHTVQIHFRDVVFNAGEVHGAVFPAADAVAGALLLVVAHDGAYSGHGIVVEQDFARFHQAVFFEKLDYKGNRGMHGAALLAHGFLAVETPVCLGDDVQSHGISSLFT